MKQPNVILIMVERNEGNVLRLISARFASKTEQRWYKQAVAGETYD